MQEAKLRKFASLSPCFFFVHSLSCPSLYNRSLVHSFASLVKRGGDSTPLLRQPSTKNQHRHSLFFENHASNSQQPESRCDEHAIEWSREANTADSTNPVPQHLLLLSRQLRGHQWKRWTCKTRGLCKLWSPRIILTRFQQILLLNLRLFKIQCIHLRLRLKVVSLIVNLAVKRIGGVRSRNVHVSLRIRTPHWFRTKRLIKSLFGNMFMLLWAILISSLDCPDGQGNW